jgi:hypothetical protein
MGRSVLRKALRMSCISFVAESMTRRVQADNSGTPPRFSITNSLRGISPYSSSRLHSAFEEGFFNPFAFADFFPNKDASLDANGGITEVSIRQFSGVTHCFCVRRRSLGYFVAIYLAETDQRGECASANKILSFEG